MKTTKKKISMQSDTKIITEVITEVETITTEEIEVELITPIKTPTEVSNKPHNKGVIQAEEETQTEVIEEAALKEVAINNTHKPKTM